ncbi:MAG: hypothetical protein NZ959_09025 [Armatimonadetes bacterium]|nr:hypothetical protein [Armatimonadota bacterium]MDW8122466.1 hypothetical protein [Armatimonadota bacterium]
MTSGQQEPEEVKVVEEEEREEPRRKRKSLKRRISDAIVALVGEEAARHLINAEVEILKAFRAMVDERIRQAERAREKLQKIEVS